MCQFFNDTDGPVWDIMSKVCQSGASIKMNETVYYVCNNTMINCG